MGYNKSPFKMAPKSPVAKKLQGNQGKLPQHLQEAIKAAPESPAKAMTGPGVQKEAGKTGTGASLNHKQSVNREYEARKSEKAAAHEKSVNREVAARKKEQGAATASKKKATPKYDKELNTLVASRKGLKKGTAEYNTIQNKINAKLGNKKVHGRGTSTATNLKSKETRVAPKQKATTPKPAAQKPAASKGPSQADKFENVLAKENAKGPMGSETGSKAPVKKPAAQKPVVSKKPAAKKTVGQKVKGTVKKARLAQLDRKANRQEARTERKANDKTIQARKAKKAERQTKRAAKLTARANKLTNK